MKILFIGDIFGKPGIDKVVQIVPKIRRIEKIDFVIAQGENISNRKGLTYRDYKTLKDAGIDAFTMGNHVWAKDEIFSFIDKTNDIIRPLNTQSKYGKGSLVFNVNGKTFRVTCLLGNTYMQLFAPWEQTSPDSFFDAIDKLFKEEPKTDFHFIDFHAETSSEKSVLSLYLDGKINALCGTHTHIQTNDAKTLPKGTAYITDAGMTGPSNCAIGANFDEVYQKMRYGGKHVFRVGRTPAQFNGVIIKMSKKSNKIKQINIPGR